MGHSIEEGSSVTNIDFVTAHIFLVSIIMWKNVPSGWSVRFDRPFNVQRVEFQTEKENYCYYSFGKSGYYWSKFFNEMITLETIMLSQYPFILQTSSLLEQVRKINLNFPIRVIYPSSPWLIILPWRSLMSKFAFWNRKYAEYKPWNRIDENLRIVTMTREFDMDKKYKVSPTFFINFSLEQM